MDNYVTKSYLDTALAELLGFLEPRFEAIEKKLEGVATKSDVDRILNTVDAFAKRIEDTDVDNAVRDIQLSRHDRWINKLAHKTQTKLDY